MMPNSKLSCRNSRVDKHFMFLESKLGLKVWILFLTVVFAVMIVGETLFLSVSPFDTSWGILAKARVKFWKFDIGLNANVDLAFKSGFPQLKPNFDNLIEHFNFESEPYVVRYSILGVNVPFTTFLNPAKRSWYASWVNTGYVDEYVFHKGEFLSVLGNGDRLHVTLDFKVLETFFERDGTNLSVGVGKFLYLYMGSKRGLGFFYPQKDWMVYLLAYLDSNLELNLAYGFYITLENVTLMFSSDKDSGLVGGVTWKVGDLNVTGRLEREKVRVAFNFPIW